MSLKGVDVSRYNAYCDFRKAKADGLDFVIIKAGSGVRLDNKFNQYYNAAKKAGIGVGAYWYLYAKTVSGAIAEAKQFISCLRGKQFDYPVWLDFEDPSQSRMSNIERTNIAIAFLEEMERNGFFTGVYSMKSWFDNKFDMSRIGRYDLWVARWGVNAPGISCGMWQYSNRGKWNGIASTGEGGVDSNIAYKDYPTIIKKNGLNGYNKSISKWNKKKNNKWEYLKNGTYVKGWLKYNKQWFYFDENAEMITGWLKYNNNWFYFNDNGSMRTGWLEYNNKWYYFNSNGYMHIGWLEYNGHKFYFDDDGSMISDCSLILNGTEYIFDSKGYMEQLNICRN